MTGSTPSIQTAKRTAATIALCLMLAGCQPEAPEQAVTRTPAVSAPLPATVQTISPVTSHPPEVTPGTTWTTYGGSLSNQRYSPLDEINRDNIGLLQPEWKTNLGSGLGQLHSAQGEPVVVDDVIYLVTGENDVFALSVDTGAILWKYTANLLADGFTVCCGWAQRGLSVAEGRVYVGTLDARLIALDQQTGALVWETRVEDPARGYSITGGTRYYDGRVFVGVAGGEYGIRGSMQAFDAATGDLVWKFNTVPGPGEFGHDSWPAYNEAWRYGGAPVWQTVAIDPDLDLLYFSTGNASPDLNGAIRPGDNLFTVSILALDIDTGQYRWHFQQTHHDIWDYDSASPVVLFNVDIDGVPRKGVSQISKSGYLFLLDRITGAPLTPIVETPVPQMPEQFTAATQPIPQGDTVTGHCIREAPEGWTLEEGEGCTYSPFGHEAALFTPLTGTSWTPTSYDPRAGVLHVCATESVAGAQLTAFSPDDLGRYEHGQAIIGGAYRIPRGVAQHSWQVAMDVRDHSRVWRQEVDGCNAGSTVTAGGLLLSGRGSALVAYDSSNGQALWSFPTAAGVHANPVVFEHDGKQKILIYAGGSAFVPGPKGDAIWMLSLDGGYVPPVRTLSGVSGISTLPARPVAMPDGEPDLARGQQLYTNVCSTCHGNDGQGGHGLGAIMPLDSSVEHIFNTANAGVPEKMPSFASTFSPMELKSVAVYVRQSVLPER